MKWNKGWYLGSAIILGFIIAWFIVKEAIAIKTSQKAFQRHNRTVLRTQKTTLKEKIHLYWIELEAITDCWRLSLDSISLAKSKALFKKLKVLETRLRTNKTSMRGNLEAKMISEVQTLGRELRSFAKNLTLFNPTWSKQIYKISTLEEQCLELGKDWPIYYIAINKLYRSYLSALGEDIEKKWNLAFVEGGGVVLPNPDAVPEKVSQKKLLSTNYNTDSIIRFVEDFYIGRFELTQARWSEIMGSNPSTFKYELKPVESINIYDAMLFCNKLNEFYYLESYYLIDSSSYPWKISFNKHANGFRLPTRAEWLHAAKGGVKSKGYSYAGSNDIEKIAHYSANANNKTALVASKKYNELGLYDMSGNVYEWCTAEQEGLYYVSGGSWYNGALDCRPDIENTYNANLQLTYYGMRLLLPAKTVRTNY